MRSLALFLTPTLIIGLLVAGWYNGLLVWAYANYAERPPLETLRPNPDLKMILHRGESQQYPENTLASFRAAVAAGADFIEVDVRLTADGVPVVLHDGKLDRTTDSEGNIWDLTFAESRLVDAGSWFSPRFAGERIPALTDVLAIAEGKSCVLADIKATPNLRLIRMLRAFLERVGDGCLYISLAQPLDLSLAFNEDSTIGPTEGLKLVAATRNRVNAAQLKAFKRFWPEFPYARSFVASDDLDTFASDFPNLRVAEVNYSVLTPELVQQLHERGLFIYSTVLQLEGNAAKDFKRILQSLAQLGVNGVLINDPSFTQYHNDVQQAGDKILNMENPD